MSSSKEKKKARKQAQLLKKRKANLTRQKFAELQMNLDAQAKKRQEIDKKLCKIAVDSKILSMRDEITKMQQSFQAVDDKKNQVIQTYLELIVESDNQVNTSFTNIGLTLDKQIKTFQDNVKKLYKDMDDKITSLLEEKERVIKYFQEKYSEDEEKLNLLLYHSNVIAKAQVWDYRGKTLVRLSDLYDNYKVELTRFIALLEGTIFSDWETVFSAYKDYIRNSARKRRTIEDLRQKDIVMTKIINYQRHKIKTATENIRELRIELDLIMSGEKPRSAMLDYVHKCKKTYAWIRKTNRDEHESDKELLNLLLLSSDTAAAHIEKQNENIAQLFRVKFQCHRFETQKYKVMPLPYTIVEPEEVWKMPSSPSIVSLKSQSSLQRSHSSLWRLGSNLSRQSNVSLKLSVFPKVKENLLRLWQQTSEVELTKLALLREKELLLEENKLLCRKISNMNRKKEMSQMTKNNEDMSNASQASSLLSHDVIDVHKLTILKYKNA